MCMSACTHIGISDHTSHDGNDDAIDDTDSDRGDGVDCHATDLSCAMNCVKEPAMYVATLYAVNVCN